MSSNKDNYDEDSDDFKRLFPKLSLSCFAIKPVSIDTLSKLLYVELKTIDT